MECLIEKTGYEWKDNKIPFDFEFADGTAQTYTIRAPVLKKGQVAYDYIKHVYVPHPGQTTIRIPMSEGRGQRTFQNTYSFYVRTEESLWVAGVVLFLGLASLLVAIFVPIVAAGMDDPPVVNEGPTNIVNEIVLPTTEAPSLMPVPQSTPDRVR